jgi:hypothetical protein
VAQIKNTRCQYQYLKMHKQNSRELILVKCKCGTFLFHIHIQLNVVDTQTSAKVILHCTLVLNSVCPDFLLLSSLSYSTLLFQVERITDWTMPSRKLEISNSLKWIKIITYDLYGKLVSVSGEICWNL